MSLIRGGTSGASALTLLSSASLASAQDSDGDGVPNAVDAFPCDGTTAAESCSPARGVHGMSQFEDFLPVDLELDFNDVVLAYNYTFQHVADGRVVRMRATFNALAPGGIIDHGFALQLPAAASAVQSITRTIAISNDLRADLFPRSTPGRHHGPQAQGSMMGCLDYAYLGGTFPQFACDNDAGRGQKGHIADHAGEYCPGGRLDNTWAWTNGTSCSFRGQAYIWGYGIR